MSIEVAVVGPVPIPGIVVEDESVRAIRPAQRALTRRLLTPDPTRVPDARSRGAPAGRCPTRTLVFAPSAVASRVRAGIRTVHMVCVPDVLAVSSLGVGQVRVVLGQPELRLVVLLV